MFMTCEKCGERFEDVTNGSSSIGQLKCKCGNIDKYKKLPLFVLTGASGVGKSTVGRYLQRDCSEIVVMESDLLWNEYYNKPETNYREYRETWLKLCKNISQNGKPVLLVGCVVPEQFEQCKQRIYFESINYIALVTSNKMIEEHLFARPSFRNSGNQENVLTHQKFNEWLKENADKTDPEMVLINNECLSIDETVKKVIESVEKCLK